MALVIDESSIPLADDDPQVLVIEEPEKTTPSVQSTDSFRSSSPDSMEPEINTDEIEEKARLITQVLELQNTLDDLSQRVDNVKEENLKLKSENQVLGQYIENLMSASSVFQSTASPNLKKK